MKTANVSFATDGTPSLTDIANATLIGGCLASVTGALSHTQVVLPESLIEKVAVEGTKVAVGAMVQKYISSGVIGIPFKA